MSKRKLQAMGAAGRWLPKNSSAPSQRAAGSVSSRRVIPALWPAYASRTSFIVAGTGGGAHSAVPLSSASMSILSSQTIYQAISWAVRDFGSGRYADPSGILESTLSVVRDSSVQSLVKSDFSSIPVPPDDLERRKSGGDTPAERLPRENIPRGAARRTRPAAERRRETPERPGGTERASGLWRPRW